MYRHVVEEEHYGVWYVTTAVKWDGPGDRAEGASMMKLADVRAAGSW